MIVVAEVVQRAAQIAEVETADWLVVVAEIVGQTAVAGQTVAAAAECTSVAAENTVAVEHTVAAGHTVAAAVVAYHL